MNIILTPTSGSSWDEASTAQMCILVFLQEAGREEDDIIVLVKSLCTTDAIFVIDTFTSCKRIQIILSTRSMLSPVSHVKHFVARISFCVFIINLCCNFSLWLFRNNFLFFFIAEYSSSYQFVSLLHLIVFRFRNTSCIPFFHDKRSQLIKLITL